MVGAADIPAFRSMRTLRALRPLRAVSRWEGMRVSSWSKSDELDAPTTTTRVCVCPCPCPCVCFRDVDIILCVCVSSLCRRRRTNLCGCVRVRKSSGCGVYVWYDLKIVFNATLSQCPTVFWFMFRSHIIWATWAMCQCCAYIMDVFQFFLLSLTLSRLTSGFLVFLVFVNNVWISLF